LVGSPFAMNMNKHIIENMLNYQQAKSYEKAGIQNALGLEFVQPHEVASKFYQFLFKNRLVDSDMKFVNVSENGEILPVIDNITKPIWLTVAGKNFGTFDKIFLENLPKWTSLFKFKSRIIDPSILFVDWKTDKDLPSLQKCKDRAHIDGKVSHDAIEDAWDVIQLLRTQY
jgi:hypothetical protein